MAAANSVQVLEPREESDVALPDSPPDSLPAGLPDDLPENLTLLELVYAISAITDDDQVVVNTVVKMLTSGRVQLRGNFRGDPIEDFLV